MIHYFRRRLRWKIFLSYLVVVLVGALVLVAAMEFATPRAFERHLTNMEMTFTMEDSHLMGTGRAEGHMADDLLANFRTAVTEATLIALTTAACVLACAPSPNDPPTPIKDRLDSGTAVICFA